MAASPTRLFCVALATCLVLWGCNETRLNLFQTSSLSESKTDSIPVDEVLVTTRAIIAGEEFSPQNCRVTNWPIPFIPEGKLSSLREIDGKVALGPIPANSVVARNLIGKAVVPLKLSSVKAESQSDQRAGLVSDAR